MLAFVYPQFDDILTFRAEARSKSESLGMTASKPRLGLFRLYSAFLAVLEPHVSPRCAFWGRFGACLGHAEIEDPWRRDIRSILGRRCPGLYYGQSAVAFVRRRGDFACKRHSLGWSCRLPDSLREQVYSSLVCCSGGSVALIQEVTQGRHQCTDCSAATLSIRYAVARRNLWTGRASAVYTQSYGYNNLHESDNVRFRLHASV